jgi:hypothetical protein
MPRHREQDDRLTAYGVFDTGIPAGSSPCGVDIAAERITPLDVSRP